MNRNVKKGRERREKILLTLDKLHYASRSQLQEIHGLGSNRNACRILQEMKPLIRSFRSTENIYYLSKKGRELIGSDKVMSKPNQVRHILLRNEAYVMYGEPELWLIERPVKLRGINFLVPDVTFAPTKDSNRFLLEVDCTQKMNINERKIKRYAELKNKTPGEFPMLIWITETKSRVKALESLCENQGLEHQVIYYPLQE